MGGDDLDLSSNVGSTGRSEGGWRWRSDRFSYFSFITRLYAWCRRRVVANSRFTPQADVMIGDNVSNADSTVPRRRYVPKISRGFREPSL